MIGVAVGAGVGIDVTLDVVAGLTRSFRAIIDKSMKSKHPEISMELSEINKFASELDTRRMIYTGNLREQLYERLGMSLQG